MLARGSKTVAPVRGQQGIRGFPFRAESFQVEAETAIPSANGLGLITTRQSVQRNLGVPLNLPWISRQPIPSLDHIVDDGSFIRMLRPATLDQVPHTIAETEFLTVCWPLWPFPH